MDINTLRGLATLLLLLAFIGLVAGIYSRRQKPRFEEAAQLPFADEAAHRKTLAQQESDAKAERPADALKENRT